MFVFVVLSYLALALSRIFVGFSKNNFYFILFSLLLHLHLLFPSFFIPRPAVLVSYLFLDS